VFRPPVTMVRYLLSGRNVVQGNDQGVQEDWRNGGTRPVPAWRPNFERAGDLVGVATGRSARANQLPDRNPAIVPSASQLFAANPAGSGKVSHATYKGRTDWRPCNRWMVARANWSVKGTGFVE
jgi:hypothetical protein